MYIHLLPHVRRINMEVNMEEMSSGMRLENFKI